MDQATALGKCHIHLAIRHGFLCVPSRHGIAVFDVAVVMHHRLGHRRVALSADVQPIHSTSSASAAARSWSSMPRNCCKVLDWRCKAGLRATRPVSKLPDFNPVLLQRITHLPW